jgi:hypothetical protein
MQNFQEILKLFENYLDCVDCKVIQIPGWLLCHVRVAIITHKSYVLPL